MLPENHIVGYILNENNEPEPVYDILKWARWLEAANRVVKQTRLPNGVFISTVFLGLDHGFNFRNDANYKPVLWETMVFGDATREYEPQMRYTSWEDAFEGHMNAVDYYTNQLESDRNKEGDH